MAKDKKVPVSKGDKSEKIVLDYLIKQNRPYGVTDIVANLHGAVTKPECQRVVAALVEKNLLTCKSYGKQGIYVVRQDNIDSATPEELGAIDREISDLRTRITEQKGRNKQLSSELSSLNASLTAKQILERLDQLNTKNEKAAENLSLLQSGTKLVTPEEKNMVVKEMDKHRKLWAARKRLFKDMFAAVTENMPGKPKDLLDELDIDQQDPIDININPRDLLS